MNPLLRTPITPVKRAGSSTRRPSRHLRNALITLTIGTVGIGSLTAGAGHPETFGTGSADDASVAADAPADSGMPDGVPAAASAAEPTLPDAQGWEFSEEFPRTSGTSRLIDGALLWADWLYDDTGAGDYTYSAAEAASNGADIFRAGVAADEDNTYWRIDWNTLVDADVPIAAWTFDTDSDAGTGVTEWPAHAGVTSPGIDSALVVSSRGAWVIDLTTGEQEDVTSFGGAVTLDMDAKSFVVTIPRSALPVNEVWNIRLAAGVADSDGTGFAPAPESTDATRVYNAAFRDMADEPPVVDGNSDASSQWNNGRQSERLIEGDVSEFVIAVDWDDLLSGVTTPEAMPTGYSTRWFVSSVEIAQGFAEGARRSPGPAVLPATFWGRVQPYTVYVPTQYTPETPAPLTILLHGGNSNHNGFIGDRKDDVYLPMCEERGSICVTPLGRGLSSWYINHAELDVWEAWNRVAKSYSLNSERTVIGGFSMGGVGATHFLTNHPDLFAGAAIVSGAGYYNTAELRDREGAELRVENLGSVRTYMESGSNDIALANTEHWDRTAEDAGIPYRAHYYDGADHGMLGSWLGWSDAAEYLNDAPDRVTSPSTVTFRWEPGDEREDLGMPVNRAYWLSGLEPRDDDARWSRVTATSHALQTTRFVPRLTDDVQVISDREVRVRDQRLNAEGAVAPYNGIDLQAENSRTMTVDLDAAELDATTAADMRIHTDGEIELELTRAGEQATIVLPAGDHRVASPTAPGSVTAFAAGATRHIHWAVSDSDLPITYTVRDPSGEILCETTDLRCLVIDRGGEAPKAVTVTASNIVGTSEGTHAEVTRPGR
ncbi:alpha/beta hydrolase-fold protein [Microbacterium murale]|uniref:Pimeloyl-ACP methyl ester carboxylesterase n=1 Tax=Microbacterium murale TaxID=1081040 RepID=A0ABU0P7A8_9MICO|nr:alpha/beta hydrolase-fold protein [Microbacterium murale]MDQ0643223.1 pimeloyl-ACP methyl ester carboxylesterase [Microbacterium murale]